MGVCGIVSIAVDVVGIAVKEVALEHAIASGIIREAVFGVDAWDLALEQAVSNLDRFWQAFFAYFASVFSFVTFFEHNGFGLTSRRRTWERLGAGCEVGAEEVLAEITFGAVGVLVRGGARYTHKLK